MRFADYFVPKPHQTLFLSALFLIILYGPSNAADTDTESSTMAGIKYIG